MYEFRFTLWITDESGTLLVVRMPVALGNFISKRVYGGQLCSQHPMEEFSCCVFVDVRGKEIQELGGTSWKVETPTPYYEQLADLSQNLEEIESVVSIAEKLTLQKKRFKIITPYDVQRNGIQNALKEKQMVSEDKCFNIDSFQGSYLSVNTIFC